MVNIRYLQDAANFFHTAPVYAMVQTERHIITGSGDFTIKIWNREEFLEGKRDMKPVIILRGHTGVVKSLALVDEKRLVSASWDNTIKLWDIQDGSCISTMEGHAHWVTSVVTINAKRLASASNDNTIKLWDI